MHIVRWLFNYFFIDNDIFKTKAKKQTNQLLKTKVFLYDIVQYFESILMKTALFICCVE